MLAVMVVLRCDADLLVAFAGLRLYAIWNHNIKLVLLVFLIYTPALVLTVVSFLSYICTCWALSHCYQVLVSVHQHPQVFDFRERSRLLRGFVRHVRDVCEIC